MGSGSIVLGVDPGCTGALAFLDETRNAIVGLYDMPTIDGDRRTEVDFLALVSLVEKYNPRICVTEDCWAWAKNSAQSAFTFGAAYGCLIGAFSYMRRELVRVRPQLWQATMFPLGGLFEKHDTKQASIFVASKLYPTAQLIRPKARKPNHDRSDALLIAAYASRLYPNAYDSPPKPSDRKAGK